MAIAFYVLSLGALIAWIYFLWSRRRFYKVAWQLPGPIGLPFIGMGFNMMNPETFLQYMEQTGRNYPSPLISWMGTNCFLYVNEPATIETIFNSPHCTNKGYFYRFLAAAIGDGLFTSSSPRWNKHRRLLNPAFSRQIISNFLPIFNAEADVLMDKFDTEGGQKLEIYQMLKRSVLEAACQTTMGKKMNFHSDGSATIFTAYSGLIEVSVKRMLSPWLYLDVIFRRSPLFTRQQKVVNVLYSFIENLLQHGNKSGPAANTPAEQLRLGQVAEDADVGADDTGISGSSSSSYTRKSKDIFVEQVRNCVEQGQLSWDDVRDEANVIIAATFETTSTALYLVCLCLAMHPEYQDKLYQELLELCPADDSHTHTEVTSAMLERMTYTEMVINEAMRLFAPVPIVLRTASADFSLKNGVVIPQGTQIGIDIFNMQRSKRVWGPSARCFQPELHFGPEAEARHPFAFIPFTKGLRMCIGYRYALMLMKVVVAKIFRNFRLSTTAKLEDLIIKGTISLKLREYPLCVVERR